MTKTGKPEYQGKFLICQTCGLIDQDDKLSTAPIWEMSGLVTSQDRCNGHSEPSIEPTQLASPSVHKITPTLMLLWIICGMVIGAWAVHLYYFEYKYIVTPFGDVVPRNQVHTIPTAP